MRFLATRTSQRGFSLVELMVVVAIIGVLAAIAVPNFQRFAMKSKQSEAKNVLSAIYSAERAFFAEWSMHQGSFPIIGYQPVGTFIYQHGFGVNIQLPVGHPQFTAAIPGNFSTQVPAVCSQTVVHNADGCRVLQTPLPPLNIPATSRIAVGGLTFIAEARGDIDGVPPGRDRWTIDESKTLVHVFDDITN